MHGQPYALKRARGGGDNEEQNALEKLLFTDAVVRVFAFFSHQNEIYMVMEKGQRSLRNMAEQGERLSGDQVLDAASRFKYLINVERRLNMRNSDVKPDNILLASDNRLKIIDIHPFAFSQGFIGSEGELYARSLLENLLGKSFRGGDISLDRYYEFSDPNYRARRVASLDFMAEWLKITCHAITSRDDPRCANARSFSEIFGYFTRPKLHEIALRINAHLQDDTGTHDNQYGIYRTGLPLPHVVDLDAPTWNNYFTQKNAIGSKFCKAILNEDSYPMYQNFFAEIRTTYSVNCNQIDDRTFQFMENFAGANDARFRLWITDALSPQVKLETFSQLAREQRFMDTMDIIFQKLHDIDNGGPVGQSLWQLYHLPR